MYIHSSYKFINLNQSTSYYKKLLKEVSNINLRRSNKFDILAVYGAVKCMKEKEYSLDTNIYLSSQYGVVSGVLKVLPSIDCEEPMIMPFDFLNMNGNNAGFNISKALNTQGENILFNSNNFSFEHALKYTLNKAIHNNDFEAIVGIVDESLSNIPPNNTPDISSWIYLSYKKDNAIAKIEDMQEFTSTKELTTYFNNFPSYKVIYTQCVNLIEELKRKSNFILVSKNTENNVFMIRINLNL
jgi:hypothetical protein